MPEKIRSLTALLLASMLFTSCSSVNGDTNNLVSSGYESAAYVDTTDTEGIHETTSETEIIDSILTADPSEGDMSLTAPDGGAVLTLSASTANNESPIKPATVYDTLYLSHPDSGDTKELAKPAYTSIDVYWSKESRYAALIGTQNSSRFPMTALLIDTVNETSTELPALEIYNSIIRDYPNVKVFLSISLTECEWISDEQLKISFNLNTGAAYYPQTTSGWYVWDINTQTVAECVYEIKEIDAADTSFSTDEIAAIVDENLDILMTDSDGYYSEKEFISAHPDAFDNIIALGNAALPYLKEIGKRYNFIGEDTSDNSRCFMAKAAEYVIDPDIYDRVFPSPNGQYKIIATVNSFFDLTDPFQGIKYNLNMIKSETNEVLAIADRPYQLYSDLFADANIQWSPDGRYASLKDSYRNMYTYIYIFDAVNSAFYSLPRESEIEATIGKKLEYTDGNGRFLDRLHCLIEKWEATDVKVRIVLSDSSSEGAVVGWYLYDLEKQCIAEIQVDFQTNT